MKQFPKTIVIIFAITIGLTAIWFSLDRTTKCKLTHNNIACFYAVLDMAEYNLSASDFEKMMNLCGKMSNIPKKDSCFKVIAEVFSHIDIEEAQRACNEIKEFDGVHSKKDCHIKIQEAIEVRRARGVIVEFMEARLQRDEKRALIWLTDNAKGQYLVRSDLPLVGLSNPHLADFKILAMEPLDSNRFKFKVRIYEEYTGEGIVDYFDEIVLVIKKDGKYMVDSLVERSGFINL